MGIPSSTLSTEDHEQPTPCPSAQRMHPGALAYWQHAKERQAAFVAGRLFREENMMCDIMACVSKAAPEVYLKGGAAAWLHLKHQRQVRSLPQLGRGTGHIADLDFGFVCSDRAALRHVVPKIGRALPGISNIAARGNLVGRFEKAWPTWKVRMDGLLGESFQGKEKRSMGTLSIQKHGRRVPMKMTHHAACRDNNTGNNFDLLRIGLAVWNKPLRLQSVVPFVDLCTTSAPPATMHIEGIRVQTPRSLLRDLRRLLFHETDYRPWCSNYEGYDYEAKLERRCNRLVQLSVLADYNEEGGSDVAVNYVRQHWLDSLPPLFAARAERIRSHASTAPRQLKYFLLVCARACEQAVGPDASEEYHACLHDVFVPRLELALQGFNRSRV